MNAMGAKMNTGSQAQNCGLVIPRMVSVASSLQVKFVTRQAAVTAKLTRTADFIALGSRQTRTGRHTISITRFMRGSVTRKCFWLAS